MKSKFNFKMLSAVVLTALFLNAGCRKEDHTADVNPENAPSMMKGAPERITTVTLFADFILDYNFNTPLDDTALVFEALQHNPVTAPDGHQLTLAEFNSVTGRASLKCVEQGTHVVLNMHGLIPNGVYSFFTSTFQSPGYEPTLQYMTADGALGLIDGSQNTVVADANAVSEFGSIDACLSDEFQVIFSAIYHIDGISYGPVPGPLGTWAFQFGFVYNF
jgi:hypothetical protein